MSELSPCKADLKANASDRIEANPIRSLALFTHASIDNWSMIIRICKFDDSLPFSIVTSEFKPMFFSSGTFTISQVNWTKTQEEYYPIIKGYERYEFILEGRLAKTHFLQSTRT